MNFKSIATILALVTTVTSVLAQQPNSTPSSERSAAQPQDCGSASRTRHDHGMEKGTGPAGKRSCTNTEKEPAKQSPDSAPSPKGHDHGKFHKGQ